MELFIYSAVLMLTAVSTPCVLWTVFQLQELKDMGMTTWVWNSLTAFTFIAAIANPSGLLFYLSYFVTGQELLEARIVGAVLGVLAWIAIYWRKPLGTLIKEKF